MDANFRLLFAVDVLVVSIIFVAGICVRATTVARMEEKIKADSEKFIVRMAR